MAEIVLQPFRHRAGKLAPDRRKEPLVLTPAELFEMFSLNTRDKLDQIRIHHLRAGAYVGISLGRTSKQPTCFVFESADGSPSYAWILSKDPGFEDRIQEVYKVEKVLWDGKIEEVPR